MFPRGWSGNVITLSATLFGLALVIFLLVAQRRRIRAAVAWSADRWWAVNRALTAGADRRHRADLMRRTSDAHLGAALFPLEKVIVPPRFRAPPPPVTSGLPVESDRSALFPYMPDWPELALAYGEPALSLKEVLEGGANLLIVGPLGAGKSVCLAEIARMAAAGEPLPDPVERIPFLIHAGDLPVLEEGRKDPVEALVAAVRHRASTVKTRGLSGYIKGVLRFGRGLILLDGLDELPDRDLRRVAEWLAKLLHYRPGNRVVAAGPQTGFAPFQQLGLVPVTVRAWDKPQVWKFISHWGEAWQAAALEGNWPVPGAEVDPLVLNGWLTTGNAGRTPLETTLKVWSAYACDARGRTPAHGVDAFLRRRFPHPAARRALESLSLLQVSGPTFGIAHHHAYAALTPVLEGTGWDSDAEDLLIDLADRGLVVRHPGDRYSLLQPAVAAILAAGALASNSGPESPDAARLTPHLFPSLAAAGDVGPMVSERLEAGDGFLRSDLLEPATWLRLAPPHTPWRGQLYRRLAEVLLDPEAPPGLRARVLCALLSSRDETVVQLFRAGLLKDDSMTRSLSALGLGALNDAASLKQLVLGLQDGSAEVRQASCYALALIGDRASLDVLAEALVSGDEDLKWASARALSLQREGGHQILREAVQDQDILVQRAAVIGLGQVDEPWARRALEEVRVSEEEWIVRTQAEETLQQRERRHVRRITPPTPVHELGWLAAFAAKRNTGLPPGPAAYRLLVWAAREGTTEERAAAAEILGQLGTDDSIQELYRLLDNPDPQVSDSAFEALAFVAAARGVPLPAPQ